MFGGYIVAGSSWTCASMSTTGDPSHTSATLRRVGSLRHQTVVVEAEELDHVADVCFTGDAARGRTHLAGEHRVVDDPALGVQLLPQRLREAEVCGVVSVQVTD